MLGAKSALMYLVIAVVILGVVVIGTIYFPKLNYSPDGKYAVAMAGRSVMDIWFRNWNIPSVLNDISVWKSWPIPYHRYQRDGYFFQYIPVEPPHRNINKPGVTYGQEMYNSLVRQVSAGKYDAALFKFCFVDFGDESLKSREDAQKRLEGMTGLVKKVHAFAREKRMKLLLCNSLPVLQPGGLGQEVRLKLNEFVDQYVKSEKEVVKVDLFGTLSDEKGKLRKEFSVDLRDQDSHPNAKAFELLDEVLAKALQKAKST